MNLSVNFQTQANLDSKRFSNDDLNNHFEKFKAVIDSEKVGFFQLTDHSEHLDKAQDMYEKHREKTHFIQVGIGGSALGPQALIDALKTNKKVKFSFMDNTDAEYISDVLSEIENPKKSLFYVVSKSGGTAETIANFSIARNFLRDNGIEEEQLKNHFVFCTDPSNGQLKEYADKHGYSCLQVPYDIGGRFSVFSHVGLFPALFAGIQIDELFEGANEIKASLLNSNLEENILLQAGAHIMCLLEDKNVNQTVLMPYSSKLKTLSHWFVQLWGESLGKVNSIGTNVGLTPIPAYGATDQHSQMQLFMEGPSDKVIFLLEVKNKSVDFNLGSGLEMDSAKKLESFKLNQLIEAQFNGTLKALKDQKKNVIKMSIDRNDPKHMGALILFFESLTALMGEYMEIDAFNQPGVELGKKYAYEYLKNLN
tara:strand:+ start:41 stop:1312 length:1272 start_codon:yes stop_codon:yes gene_type:complete